MPWRDADLDFNNKGLKCDNLQSNAQSAWGLLSTQSTAIFTAELSEFAIAVVTVHVISQHNV